MKNLIYALAMCVSLITLQACNGNNSSTEMENTDIVESGTYTGTAARVDAEEKEIYVETQDGKTLELYFTDQTELTRNGETVTFDALQQGQNIEVQVEKKGQRLEPVAVKILE
jgi:CspA family cold shock protein